MEKTPVHTICVKFVKESKFQNLVFTASEKIDKESYDFLLRLSAKITAMFPGSFSPVYHSVHGHVSATITNNNFTVALKPNCVYRLNLLLYKKYKQRDNSPYLVLKLSNPPQYIRAIQESADIFHFE